MNEPTESEPFRLLIAGGGVAALEAFFALRSLAGDRVKATLLAPDPIFRHRPLSVTEPFGLGVPRGIDLTEMTMANGGSFFTGALAEVDAERRLAITDDGHELEYDALLIAIGARGGTTIPGALAFWDSADRGAFRGVLEQLEEGLITRLAFAVPGDVTWPLGLYELALLTRAYVREIGLKNVELTLVTSEPRPLGLFGDGASNAVGRLLASADIEIRQNTTPVRFKDGGLEVTRGPRLDCDQVVSLPIPEVSAIAGIPQDPRGFIPTDRFGQVLGVERVYAAGDATSFPIKQGGIATQAADAAASAVAELAGADIVAQPFQPVLRGAILTEWGPRYLRARTSATTGVAARSPLWWPPAKVAGRYLAPYLAQRAGYTVSGKPLKDLEPPPGDDPTETLDGHEDVVALALASAKANAASRDYKGALRWLEVAEDLELYLPSEYEPKREAWTALAELGRRSY